jgi:hypothetical protein
MSQNVFVNNLTATGTVQGSYVVPRIYLQMYPSGINCPSPGATRNAIGWATTGVQSFGAGTTGVQSYISGSWTLPNTNGRISVPVSGLYAISLWGSLSAAGWLALIINGTQAVDVFTECTNAVSSGPRLVATSYQNTGNGISLAWTGYLSTSDYFYALAIDPPTVGTLVLGFTNGISVTFLGAVI